jgi:hypothetical protein
MRVGWHKHWEADLEAAAKRAAYVTTLPEQLYQQAS